MGAFTGELLEIHRSDSKGGEAAACDRVEVRAGVGLVGDRYGETTGKGAPKQGGARAVTLIEAEALDAVKQDYGIELSAAASRRNLLVRGVPLNHLVGREFRVGAARLRGTELCEPCGYLEKRNGVPGLREALVHRGGLRAEVLEGATLVLGDPVTPA